MDKLVSQKKNGIVGGILSLEQSCLATYILEFPTEKDYSVEIPPIVC